MNEEFLERIRSYIPDEYDAFVKTLSQPMYRGLRIQTHKIDPETFFAHAGMRLQKAPFSDQIYYIDRPMGHTIGHIAGLFYLQEPSASSAVTALDVQPDDTVLDLCAAPGGKSTQIADRLTYGFLVSNEISRHRAMTLLSNMERMGVMNMAVTNLPPEKLCEKTAEAFDKVLVDAPCSGEGMMKKHAEAADWSLARVLTCADRQKEILKSAYRMLKKDGTMVYSTCTYAKEENEEVIRWFLAQYPDMKLVPVEASFGRPGFGLSECRRIFPMDGGEGHFVAKLVKTGGGIGRLPIVKSDRPDASARTFIKQQIGRLPAYFQVKGSAVFAMEHPFLKLPALRQGIYVGDVLKNRFEPAHAFYMNADWIDAYQMKAELNEEQADAFYHGMPVVLAHSKGFTAVCVNGYPIGYGKSDGRQIKNKLPKGLRLPPHSHIKKEFR